MLCHSRAVDDLEALSFPEAEVVLRPCLVVIKCHKEGDPCRPGDRKARCQYSDAKHLDSFFGVFQEFFFLFNWKIVNRLHLHSAFLAAHPKALYIALLFTHSHIHQ